MKRLGCRDLGVDCDFAAKGEKNEDIKKELWAHAEKMHPKTVQSMTPEKKKAMTAKMDELLKRPTAPPSRVGATK